MLVFPSPIFHSPKAAVLPVPSTMSRIEMAPPPNWNTPLGGPPAAAAVPEAKFKVEPAEAK